MRAPTGPQTGGRGIHPSPSRPEGPSRVPPLPPDPAMGSRRVVTPPRGSPVPPAAFVESHSLLCPGVWGTDDAPPSPPEPAVAIEAVLPLDEGGAELDAGAASVCDAAPDPHHRHRPALAPSWASPSLPGYPPMAPGPHASRRGPSWRRAPCSRTRAPLQAPTWSGRRRRDPGGPIRSGGSRWSRSLPGGGPSGGPSGGPPPRGGPPAGGHPVDPRWTFRPPGPPPSSAEDTAKRLSLESGGPVDPLYRSLGRESSLICLCDISYQEIAQKTYASRTGP